MDHGVDPGERRAEAGRTGHVAGSQLDAAAVREREPAQDGLTGGLAPDQGDDPVAGVEQGRHDVPADEPAGPGDEDGRHGGRVASGP